MFLHPLHFYLFLFVPLHWSSFLFISVHVSILITVFSQKPTRKRQLIKNETADQIPHFLPTRYPTFTPTKDHTELPVPEDITFLYIKKKYLIAGVCKNCYDKLLQVYPKELLWFSINLFFWNLPHKCNWYKTQLPHPPSNHPTYTPKKGMVFNMVK